MKEKMPTRIIREGILTSEPVNGLSESAENFYRRLMSVADDYGRYYSHPSILRANCYPLKLESISEAVVNQSLAECVSSGLISLYGDGKKYLQIHKFNQQTRSKSKFPEPDKQTLINCKSVVKQIHSLDGDVFESGDEDVKLGEFPESLRTARVLNKWGVWMNARRGMKKPKNWAVLFNEQIDWLSQFQEPQVFEILSASIRNGWQGLFPPKNENNTKHPPQHVDRSVGTANEGRAHLYKNLGRVVKVADQK